MKKSIIAGSVMALGLAGMFGASNVSAATTLDKDLTLQGHVTDCYTIESGDITIDLNGYNITCDNDDAIRVENGATLTITGNGNVTTTSNGHAAIYTNIGGETTVNGGKYLSLNWYVIKNLGTTTVNDGTFFQDAGNTSNSSLIDNGWGDASSATGAGDQGNAWSDGLVATLTINGGYFNHNVTTTSNIKSDDASKSIINNGTFKSENGYLVQASGEAIINGGDFTGNKAMITIYGDSSTVDPGKATVNSGTVNAQYLADAGWGGGTISVTGGNFNLTGNSLFEPFTEYFIKSTTITGGTYNVSPENYLTTAFTTVYANDTYTVAKVAEGLPEGTTSVIDATHEVTEAEQAAVDKLGVTGLNQAAAYEITLTNATGEPVTDLGEDAATFTLPLPANLPAVADGYTRKFYVIRIHDNSAAILSDATVNADGTISFSSNLFSTFIIGYADTKTATTDTNTNTVASPNTGYATANESGSATASFTSFAAIVAVSIALFAGKKLLKKEQ